MLRSLALLLPLATLAACAEGGGDPEAADADGLSRVRRLQMAQLNLVGATENCGNQVDDDNDGDVDFQDSDCGGGFFDDMMEGSNIHPGDTGKLSLWDGVVRFEYVGATTIQGGSLRLDRPLYDTRGRQIGTATTRVELGRGDITSLSAVLPTSRGTLTATGLALGTSDGAGWLVEDGFAHDEIYED